MTASYTTLQVNPFEDNIVREPRTVSFSVKGLNDTPLNAILKKFSVLAAEEPPLSAPVQACKAQLVVSPDRGYGKSHLLGRLFTSLGRRATKVYLRPFQDPHKAWHSILLLTIQELEQPEDETPNTPSQLKAFAIGTLAHVVADLATDRPEIVQAGAILRQLGRDPASVGEENLKRISAMISDARDLGLFCECLRRRHIDLHGKEKAWLKILAACTLDDLYGPKRTVALKWLRAEPLEQEEAALLGLDTADNEGSGDSSAQEINDLSSRRMRGLCQLASFYRPFVFCFDQTEFFCSDPALIKALGNCIEQLYADLRNHITVITANQENWLTQILPHLEPAQRDRIDRELRLEGIRIEGARELIEGRLKDYGFESGEIEVFFSDGWLEQVFSPLPKLGVRTFLMHAADRFTTLARPSRPPIQKPKPDLDELFKLEMNGVRSKKALMAYNQDALMWFVKDIGQGLAQVAIERPQNHRYFSLGWSWPDRRVCFAFEGGDHWKRWRSIAAEGVSLARSRGDRTFLCYVFRTPDLKEVPKDSWTAARPTIEEAMANGFQVVTLKLDQVCELQAARELYSNALQGNIDYDGPTTLNWLQERFLPLLKQVAFKALQVPTDGAATVSKKPNGGPAPSDLPIELEAGMLDVVLNVVREKRIVDISTVLGKLGNTELRDPLLRSVEAHPNLKAHPGPKTIFLQWRTTP